jgi:uncharacterized membrane protein YqjE
MSTDHTLRSLTGELIADVTKLMRQELRLAQIEAGEKASTIQGGVIAIAVGLLLGLAALLILLQALVIALSDVMSVLQASIVVGVCVAVFALILIWTGRAKLRASSLVPERTVRAVRSDKNMILERAR